MSSLQEHLTQASNYRHLPKPVPDLAIGPVSQRPCRLTIPTCLPDGSGPKNDRVLRASQDMGCLWSYFVFQKSLRVSEGLGHAV